VNLELNTVEITKLPETLTLVTEMAFYAGYFYVKRGNHFWGIKPDTCTVHACNDTLNKFDEYVRLYKSRSTNLSYFKRLINDGYTTLNSVRSVYINFDGDLAFDDRHIAFKSDSQMIVIDHNRQNADKGLHVLAAKETDIPSLGMANTNLKFSRFAWNDGSEVLADSRGFLHLRSSDRSIPEITIVMVMGKPTACWAADGRVCGAAYFTGVDTAESWDVTGFYYNYIQRFIDTIENHGANVKV
jgi:hypothetical protein